MMLKFESLEEFSVASEARDATVAVKLHRQLNHKPTRYGPEPYRLDVAGGRIHLLHYGIAEKHAKETATRFSREHAKGIAPALP